MAIELSDEDFVIRVCPECHGAKRVEKTTVISQHSARTEEIECETCAGRGLKLTTNGAKLFDFVREASRWSPY